MEVKGYPKYLIYDDGRVWSKGFDKKHKSRYLKHTDNGKGYMYVGLTNENNDKVVNHTIHRLVALHYIPNPNNYKEVDHIDRDKNNNHVSNLRWCNAHINKQNLGIYKSNKLGHKGVSIIKYGYQFQTQYKYIKYRSKTCKKLSEVLWVKFVFYLQKKRGFLD